MNVSNYVVPSSVGQDLLEDIRLAHDQKPKLAVYLKNWYSSHHLKEGLRSARGNVNELKTILRMPLAKLISSNEIYSYFIEITESHTNLLKVLITITPNRTMPVITIRVNITL